MLTITMPFELNTVGTDTLNLLFLRIKAAHPTLNIDKTTHYVKAIKQMSTRYKPWQSVAIIGSKTDKAYEKMFRYDRWPVSRYINNPMFTEAEIPQVQAMDEVELVAYLTTKLNLNFNNNDFMVLPDGKHYTGGHKRPNWRLTPKPNSPFWCADKIVWLHDGLPIVDPGPGPDPDPEPVGNWQKLFPTLHVPIETSNQNELYTEIYLDDDTESRTVVLTYDPTVADTPSFDLFATRATAKRGDEIRFYNHSSQDLTFYLSTYNESVYDPETDTVTNYNIYTKLNGKSNYSQYKLLSGGTMRFVLADIVTETDPAYPEDVSIRQSWYLYGVAVVEDWVTPDGGGV